MEPKRIFSFFMLVFGLAIVAAGGIFGYHLTQILTKESQLILAVLVAGVLPMLLVLGVVIALLVRAITHSRELDKEEFEVAMLRQRLNGMASSPSPYSQYSPPALPANFHIYGGEAHPNPPDGVGNPPPGPERIIILGE